VSISTPTDPANCEDGPLNLKGLWLVKEKLAKQEQVDKNLSQKESCDYAMLQTRAEVASFTSGQEASHTVLASGEKQF